MSKQDKLETFPAYIALGSNPRDVLNFFRKFEPSPGEAFEVGYAAIRKHVPGLADKTDATLSYVLQTLRDFGFISIERVKSRLPQPVRLIDAYQEVNVEAVKKMRGARKQYSSRAQEFEPPEAAPEAEGEGDEKESFLDPQPRSPTGEFFERFFDAVDNGEFGQREVPYPDPTEILEERRAPETGGPRRYRPWYSRGFENITRKDVEEHSRTGQRGLTVFGSGLPNRLGRNRRR